MTKYFRDQAESPAPPKGKRERFTLDRIDEKGRFARWKQSVLRNSIGKVYSLARRFKPVFSLAGLVHITREDDVRAILNNPAEFPVPFTDEMRELGHGATFLLGLDGEAHARQRKALARVILPSDSDTMARLSAEFTAALLDNHRGEIDAVDDLIKRVPAEICIRYFGLDCDDADALADWTLAISTLLFADPFGEPEVRDLAFQGRDKLAAHVDGAVKRIRRHRLNPSDTIETAETLIHRLLIAQRDDPSITDADIGAIAMGMASGFVPTNTVAASNMLVELLDRSEAFKAATKAAREHDDALMRKVVLEAGRLNPTLAPGQFRLCPDGAVLRRGAGETRIAPRSTLLVSTVSAMRDGDVWEDASRFRLDRQNADGSWQEPDLQFGYGPHVCIGKELAIAQISALFGELFRRENLRRARGSAGRLTFLKHLPRHLSLTYDDTGAVQTMYLMIAPVTDGSTREELEAELRDWGHPAKPELRAALDQCNIMHFTSLAPIETENGLNLIFELNCDGPIDSSLAAFVEALHDPLHTILRHTDYAGRDDVYAYMREHVVELHGKPWGATGLAYNGLGEFPVSKVERDARFADFAARVVRDFVATESDRGNHAILPLRHMRRILRSDPALKGMATRAQIALMEEAQREGFDAYSLSTGATRLALSTFDDPGSVTKAALNFFGARDGLVMTVPAGAIFLFSTIAVWFGLSGPVLQKVFLAPLLGLLLTVVCLGVLFGLAMVWVRTIEKRDKPFEKRASLDAMREILQSEDLPGYAQNQVFATANLKPGLSRRLFHTFGLWGNKMSIKYRFRPGLINGMGSIHYARWYKIPGSRRAVFYSNFDGSWESYLEDFITRVSWGQSSTWSNWEGFPETRFLFFKGAQDSDQFKNYARSVMRVSPFWYSRFPELTSEQIRRNGQIHSGAGLAKTSTEADEWLRLFASRPRHDNLVEMNEVQGLVFRGMKRLPYSACFALKLPRDGRALGEWLNWVRGRPMMISGLLGNVDSGSAQGQIDALIKEKVLTRVPRPDGQPDEFALSHAMAIAFGDRPLLGKDNVNQEEAREAMAHAAFIGFSAAGLAKFTHDKASADSIDEGLSYAFRMGMGGRGRILGDPVGEDRQWNWDDDVRSPDATEATLMLYAASPADLERMVTIHEALIANHGGAIQTRIDCAPAWPDKERIDFEHFGFRDGISQPAMRGVGRSTRGLPERDIVEPGEFIIGYKNNSGYYPMSPKVSAEEDVAGALPVRIDGNLSDFPDFGDESLVEAERDLGRNGTYLVLRELKQDVEGFDAFARKAAEDLNTGAHSDLYKVVGQRPDADWIKAKLMGRWADGRPLIGNPVNNDPRASVDPMERENDFSFGDDDPQGLACPFASHIRRTNPRESKRPGDPNEQRVSNRHRLLRRGRPYVRKETGEKGLLFACVGTDLERQFEFVQQFWCNDPAFHGLDDEPDPIVGATGTDSRTNGLRARYFSIPTNAGPVRIEALQNYVETKGGGYFFMPSRSALAWLTEAALYGSVDEADGNLQQGQST
ncbi:MAG: cytochrome P450 [Pseudomonadota bacterium]